MSHKCKRRLRIVESRLQGELLRRICLHWFSFLLCSLTLTVFMGVLTADPNLPLSNQIIAIASANFWPFLTLLALLPMFLVDMVKLSSNFAGPMVRLRRALEGLAQGTSTKPLVFRDGDFWQSSATAFNAVVDHQIQLKQRVEELEQQVFELTTQQKSESHCHNDIAVC